MIRAVGGLTNLLLTLLLPQVAVSQSILQPPVTPACVSSPFGWRHAVGLHAPAGFHNGIDLPAPAGALVHAAAAGTVETVKRQGLGGVAVHLRHPDGLVTLYAYLATLCRLSRKEGARWRLEKCWGTWHARGSPTAPTYFLPRW